MKRLIPILCVTLSLTACSGPDSSGGVALSKDPYPTNQEFPHGDCDDDPTFAETNTGCGWIHIHDKSYHILASDNSSAKPPLKLSGANLSGANLSGALLYVARMDNANLSGTNLSGAYLVEAWLVGADLTNADLSGANLQSAFFALKDNPPANLSGANLTGANIGTGWNLPFVSGVIADSSTICPNGIKWGTAGNNCGF